MATTDTDFRRGNEYYISYEAYLDLNSDGIAETKYPLPSEDGSEVVLSSQRFTPPKQEAKFKNLSSSNNGKYDDMEVSIFRY